jgi:hypothetical protein
LGLGRVCRKVCDWDGGDEINCRLRRIIRCVQRDGIGRDMGSPHSREGRGRDVAEAQPNPMALIHGQRGHGGSVRGGAGKPLKG